MAPDLDPRAEAHKLSDTVSSLAFKEPEGKQRAFIDSIIVGESIWASATRGMAHAKLGILTVAAKEAVNG